MKQPNLSQSQTSLLPDNLCVLIVIPAKNMDRERKPTDLEDANSSIIECNSVKALRC